MSTLRCLALALCAAASVAACSDGPQGSATPNPDGGGGGPEGGDAGTPKTVGTHFTPTMARWGLPTADPSMPNPFHDVAGQGWATLDLNGDGKPDLVSTTDGSGYVWGHGSTPYWRVFFGNGSGFAQAATTWPLPAADPSDSNPFHDVAGQGWATVDMNGDHVPDLVSTSNASGNVWGQGSQPYWRVYFGSSSGFASAATTWTLPAVDPNNPNPLHDLAGQGWATFDLTGDGKVDLVSTSDVSGNVWGQGSSPYWMVYTGSGSGFAPSASIWMLPAVNASDTNPFFDVVGEGWATFDLNGDSLADLVSTADTTGYVWGRGTAPYWRVFFGNGNGFAAAATTWMLPVADPSDVNPFPAAAGLGWATFDLNDDGKPDLVSTTDAAGYVWGRGNAPYWRVFFGVGMGFASSATTWTLPTVDPTDNNPFHDVAGPGWATLDINGDGTPDLVSTSDSTGNVWGHGATPTWKVFLNVP